MNPHTERALMLMQQSRHDLAEKEIRLALAAEPDDAFLHGLLADCLIERDQFAEAIQEAEKTIGLAPDLPMGHANLARALLGVNRQNQASEAIAEALRLDPAESLYHGIQAAIRYARRDWKGALSAADQGLQFDPEHPMCVNFRAMALTQLGRRDEAGATIAGALAKDPENAFSHANEGWRLLHEHDHRKALEHFREALRLEPGMEYARIGLVEALKARNPIYGLMLRYFLWMSRLSTRAQWGIIVGGYVGNQVLSYVAGSVPELRPFQLPICLAYIAFAILTWIASPVFDLTLRVSRYGRNALSRAQRQASTCIGLVLGLAITSMIAWAITGYDVPFLALLYFGLMLLPVAAFFRTSPGWPRVVMGSLAVGLSLLGAAMVLAGLEDARLALDLLRAFAWGILISTILGNLIRGFTRRR